MGDIQKRLIDQACEEPVKVERFRHWIECEGIQVPVLSLEYESQAYIKLGRTEKAEAIKKWLDQNHVSKIEAG